MCDQRQLVRIHVWWVTSNIVFVMFLMLCAFASMCVGTRTVQYKAAPRIGMDWRWFRWNPPMLMWNSLLLKFDQSIGRHPRKWNTSSLIKTDKGFGSDCRSTRQSPWWSWIDPSTQISRTLQILRTDLTISVILCAQPGAKAYCKNCFARLLSEAYMVGSSTCAPRNTPDRLVTRCYLVCGNASWFQRMNANQTYIWTIDRHIMPYLVSCYDCYDVDLTRRFWYNLEPGTRWSLFVRLACVMLLLMLLCLVASSKEFAAKCRMIAPYRSTI